MLAVTSGLGLMQTELHSLALKHGLGLSLTLFPQAAAILRVWFNKGAEKTGPIK